MKLIVFNGSPRGINSNSKLIADSFLKGYSLSCSDEIKEYFLKDKKNIHLYKEEMINADKTVFIFPLYVDAMPGVVKEFFETLENSNFTGKQIGFIIHSGFPETVHCENLEKYLERFVEILNGEYLGTVIKGGSEGLKHVSEKMRNKSLEKFYNLGEIFAEKNKFDIKIINDLKKIHRFNNFTLFILKILNFIGLFDIHWNKELKKNKSYHKRYDRPYETK